jgi:uncharacterized membrane protein YgcG
MFQFGKNISAALLKVPTGVCGNPNRGLVMRSWLRRVVCVAGLLAGSTAFSQDRSLYWDALTVEAHLDSQGALHVTERHAMVFDGAWNGGERTFQVRSWHELNLQSFAEVEPNTQTRVPWQEGDLDQIGEYRLDGNSLRWRSRQPDDPPFAQTSKTYEISYSLTGVLVPENGVYRLEHNLAFPDRSGEIRQFDATLEIDPVWEAEGVPTQWHHENLQPGESVLVTGQLKYSGAAQPSAVAKERARPSATAMPMLRLALLAIVLVMVFAHAVALVRRERRRDRFAPPLPLDRIDDKWLQENVFNRPPEMVGAAWDLDTSASEVSALLAQLVVEKKLKTEVRVSGSGWFKQETLSMELLCERSELAPHQRPLIQALFFNGSSTTDTQKIRKHYEKSGFSPSVFIEKAIQQQLPMIFANKLSVPAWAKWLTAGLFVAAIVTFIIGLVQAPDAAPSMFIAAAILLACYIFGVAFGYGYRKNVLELSGRLTRTFVFIAMLCAVLAFVLIAGRVAIVPFGLVSLTLLTLAMLNSIFNVMRTRETLEAQALRRQLGTARRYFEEELRSQTPRLKDEWFPYLLAFGLGPKVDRWFKSFGAESSATRRSAGASSGMGTQMGSSSSSSSWTGGGGTFGGAGASGTWAAAVGGIAAGVAAPSSSSSSGGRSSSSGSSSSSGGGGGGGW